MDACGCVAKSEEKRQEKEVEGKRGRARELLDLVVSHFEERLEWLWEASRVCRRIFVYHKGDPKKPLASYVGKLQSWMTKIRWVLLPNVGREGHTILHHCLQMKRNEIEGTLSDGFTLFLQGSIEDHKHLVFPFWQWDKYLAQGFVGGGVSWYENPGRIKHPPSVSATLDPPTKLTFAQFYQLLLHRPFPADRRVLVSYCNCFSTSNERILKHGQPFYERAKEMLSVGKNPEVGHYFERITLSLFGAFQPPFRPIPS